MGRKARAEAKRVGHVFVGILAVMTLCEGGEIGDAGVERGSSRPTAFRVSTVAGRAILLEHGFARGNVRDGKLVFVLHDGVVLRGERDDRREQGADEENLARSHTVLPKAKIIVARER